MKISVHKGKRIPLLFFLGIGIPCLLLGYLAFRGIQNDQALMEKEQVNEHRKISEQITKAIEENIIKTEQAFLFLIAKNKETDPSGLIGSIDSLKIRNPLVEEYFIFENSGEIILPAAKLLYLPDGSIQLITVSSSTPATAKKLPTGQQLEFQEKKYQQAFVSYQEEFEQTSDPQTKGELLSAIARVQKKASLLRDAKRTYEEIARDYNHVQTSGGVPLGLAARVELCTLSGTTGDTLTVIRTFTDLYKDLMNGDWMLEKAQYNFFSQQIKESVDAVFSKTLSPGPLQTCQNDFTVLKEAENKLRENTERLFTFRENAGADMKAKIPLKPEESQNTARRFALEIGEQAYFVSLPGGQYNDEGNQGKKFSGLLCNIGYLRDSLLRQELQNNLYSGKTAWIVKGRDDNVILKSENSPSGSVTFRANFEGGFPPWFVEFYQQEPDLFESFLFSRRGIYFFMFLLLAGILIFGLTLTIRAVAHELELSKMKSDFVSTISHEFKSPLSSIRQLSEMLQSGRVTSEDRRQQYYDVLVEQSERLTLLVDNILDFAKIEEGRKEFNFEVVDIGELLQEIASVIQDRVRHKDFVIQVNIEQPLPSVMVDRAAITQAVNNLTDNAIKYSGEARNVIIRAFAENEYMTIAVKDFGIGIRKEEIDKVFERFYRGGDELTRKVKGSGLGLTLVKQIVEVHHGKVHVDSEPGHGSTFSIRLPLYGT